MVKVKGPTLLGRDWLRVIKLDWVCVHRTVKFSPDKTKTKVEALISRYANVAEEGLGETKTFEATLHLKEGFRLIFCTATPLPFALKEAVGRELDRLETADITEKVTHSQWAALIVPVPKGDGCIRLCGDYSHH